MSVPSATDEIPRLRWQCRRGMKELDALLVAYLERRYPSADPAEKSAFAAFLALPDPVLIDYLLNRQPVEDPAIANVVEHVLRQDLS